MLRMEEITSTFPVINDRYQILNTISSGGMAVIYRATDLVLDRPVALKILKKDLSRKEDFREQFSIEAKATANLSHVNIVTTFDFGVYGERLYIAMELIEGSILKDLIPDKTISLLERISYLEQACRGLAYAHSKKIIHCDIKPQNMLVSNNGALKLTDFGISRVLDTITRESASDEIWGSPFYIAPEIAHGSPPSYASDVYSMGVVMYEVLTKELPFTGEDVLTVIEKHQEETPVPPTHINPKIPPGIDAIIQKALSKNPKKRYQDASALLDEIWNAPKSFSNNFYGNSTPEEIILDEIEVVDEKETEKPTQPELDWKTILLSFITIILVGGLVPFWLFVYYSINR